MSEFYNEIMTSIDESIEAAKEGKLKDRILVAPVKQYPAVEIRNIRTSLNMTQAVFAGVLGVSKKTVEAWESGRNTPMGPASRMLDILCEDHAVARKFVLQSN